MAQPLAAPYCYFADANGAPLAGGLVYTYTAGTTTPKNSYTDSGAGTPNANPVVLDSAGRASIWLSGNYKIVVKDSGGVTIHTDDNITSSTATGDMTKAVYDAANIAEQLVGLTAVQTLTNKKLSDSTTRIVDNSDNTKALALELSGITTATTRTWTVQDKDGTAAMTSDIAAIVGDTRSLLITRTGNATATIAADGAIVGTTLSGAVQRLASVSLTLTASGTGANGLDTGSLANSTFYYVYVIAKTDGTTACLATTAGSGATIYGGANMPSGYTFSGLVGVLLTDGSAHFLQSYQFDREIFLQAPITIFSNVTNVATLTTRSIATGCPAIAKSVSGLLSYDSLNATAEDLAVAADGTGTGIQSQAWTGTSNVTNVVHKQLQFRRMPLITAQTLFWRTGNASAQNNFLNISSFTI